MHKLVAPKAEAITLRPYQQAAVDATYEHLRARDDNPCIVIPTGGGKTPIIATICRDAVTQWQGRVLILAHVKELLQQAADKLNAICPQVDCGIYSAGLGYRETKNPVIVAGIQSVYKRADELDRFDLVLVDEAHLIPPDGEGMYRTFLNDALIVNPRLRIVGLTATPYRMSSGLICAPENLLNHVCYEVGVRELIVDGFLCPLTSKRGAIVADTSGLHVRGGEFVPSEIESLMNDDALVGTACAEIVAATRDRNACLIFAAGVKHGQHICETLGKLGVECGFVCGDTPDGERSRLLESFKAGRLKYLCNVNVLTTGFDAPNIDTVVLLRPTLSPGLYYQMVGRGFRLHPSKAYCLILDFGGNVKEHGPVDMIKVKARTTRGDGKGEAPAKDCPECNTIIAAAYSTCPACGFKFPDSDKQKHESTATNESVLSGEVTIETHEVLDIHFAVHKKKNAEDSAPKTMRVDYRLGLDAWESEWICFEHPPGFARRKAEQWWKARSPDVVPTTSERAVELANAGALATTRTITIRRVSGEDFPRITDYELGERPAPIAPDFTQSDEPAAVPAYDHQYIYSQDEIPF